MQRSCENRLRGHGRLSTTDAYHPAPLHLFSTLDRDITLAFITSYPTPQAASRVGPARMESFCRREHYSGRTTPEVLVDRLRPHLLSASPGTTAGKAFSARLFTQELQLLNEHLREYNKRMAELLDAHPDTGIFNSFPGIGPMIATTLISEMGEDRSRFPHPGALLAETGLAPVTRASGRTHQVRFRYAANRYMRHAIDWWMFVTIRERPSPRLTAGVCVIHLLRNSFRYAAHQDWDKITKAPKPVYTAPTEGADRPVAGERLAEFVLFFAFDVESRKIICSTNAVESVNARIRKAVRARGHFPNEQAALKCVYMALISLDPTP